MTSAFQPLDREVFTQYKKEFKRLNNGKKGGLCRKLWDSVNAIHIASDPMYIKASWERSNLFASDPGLRAS